MIVGVAQDRARRPCSAAMRACVTPLVHSGRVPSTKRWWRQWRHAYFSLVGIVVTLLGIVGIATRGYEGVPILLVGLGIVGWPETRRPTVVSSAVREALVAAAGRQPGASASPLPARADEGGAAEP